MSPNDDWKEHFKELCDQRMKDLEKNICGRLDAMDKATNLITGKASQTSVFVTIIISALGLLLAVANYFHKVKP